MNIRAVIDTNIWISAILNPFGYPAKLRTSFANGLFQAVISEPMLFELAAVLSRPRISDKYSISTDDIKKLLELVDERSEHVFLEGDVAVCRDADDNMVIETAIKGQVAYLVTRDDDIKYDKKVSDLLSQHKVTVTTIAKFLSILKET
jgi:putative PIN family toxin of toxin-antitoxin system